MSNVRENLAGASGAVLGYIFKGFSGAAAGYKLGKRAAKLTQSYPNMARPRHRRTPSTPTSSGRISKAGNFYITPPRTPRRIALGASRPRFKQVSRSPFLRSNPYGSDHIAKSVKRVGGSNSNNRRKKLKITKEFKEKVKEVVSAKEPIGVYRSYTYNAMYPPADNLQTLSDLQFGLTNDGSAGGCFSATEIMHAASVMWNAKTDSQTRLRADTGNFDPKATKINVINSYAQFTIKNNTQIKYECKIYEFEPKSTQQNYPQYLWNLSCNLLAAAGTTNSFASTMLKTKPTMHKMITDKFKIKEVSLVLEPGAIYIHKVQGPSNWVMDGQKHYETDSNVFGIHKHMRFPVLVYYPQIQCTDVATVGRFTDVATGQPWRIIVESEMYFKLSMPEQVGFQYPSATTSGTTQLLNRRISKWFVKNWAAGQAGIIQQVDDENPANAELAMLG